MTIRRTTAVGGALAAVCLMTAATGATGRTTVSGSHARAARAGSRLASSASAPVTVRVEGVHRTLLAAKTVRVRGGSLTKGHTPPGACPARSAAGALDVAVKHRWKGSYSSGLGIEITSVLGETHVYSAHGYYWGIWVNNRFASAGACDLKLHRGEQLLFAPAPGSGSNYPIVLTAPAHVTPGQPFQVRASYFPGTKGGSKPLAGVAITDAAAATDTSGDATVTVPSSGKVKLTANLSGYIRAEATVSAS
jgi:hypothetical protein